MSDIVLKNKQKKLQMQQSEFNRKEETNKFLEENSLNISNIFD